MILARREKVVRAFHWKVNLLHKRIRSHFLSRKYFQFASSVSGQSRFRFCTVEIVFVIARNIFCVVNLGKRKGNNLDTFCALSWG
jgi:hypothetical protein